MAQEVFLRLIRYDRSDLITHPQAYLFKIAANVSAEWAVRHSRSLPHSADWLAELVDEKDPESVLERQDTEATLLELINSLPARSREMLRLHFAEGLKYEEIAGRMGLTRRIVKRDLARAYAAVRTSMEESQTTWQSAQG
jgi:RNA polymerase sigma-70 factor (ECF subfamily)